MKYLIEIPVIIEDILSTYPKKDMLKIRDRIRKLEENPRPYGIEKIGDNRYRVRQGDYRIIYSIFDHKLLINVVNLSHRREIYTKKHKNK